MGVNMTLEMESTRIEISTSHQRNSVHIMSKMKNISLKGCSEKYSPFSKSQSFVFCWNKHMCSFFLSYDFISSSVYLTFYHPTWNFISVTTMKWSNTRNEFPIGLYHVSSYKKLTRPRNEKILFHPKRNLM